MNNIESDPMRYAVNKTSETLTAVEKLAVSMTDERISDALDQEAETILQLIIHDKTHQVAEHVGAIKSWSGMLRGRAARMPATPAPEPQPEVAAERRVPGRYGNEIVGAMFDENGKFVRFMTPLEYSAALAASPVVEEAVKAERLDAETLERRLHLWFFRDVSDDQRHGLFKLCGYPVDEIGMRHSLQQRCLQHLVSAIRARSATP